MTLNIATETLIHRAERESFEIINLFAKVMTRYVLKES
jgi:hypothetical protein